MIRCKKCNSEKIFLSKESHNYYSINNIDDEDFVDVGPLEENVEFTTPNIYCHGCKGNWLVSEYVKFPEYKPLEEKECED